MKKDEVIEIARIAHLGTALKHNDECRVWIEGADWQTELEAFANEIERRTLERAAVVCESSPSYDWHKFACEAAAAIRALKESK